MPHEDCEKVAGKCAQRKKAQRGKVVRRKGESLLVQGLCGALWKIWSLCPVHRERRNTTTRRAGVNHMPRQSLERALSPLLEI